MHFRLSLTGAAALLLSASIATAQVDFRVSYTVDRTDPAQTRLIGTVYNGGRADALDVIVTAEALDASGRVLATGVTYVGQVPERAVSRFTAKLPPAASSAASFRARVSSFRSGFSAQSP